MSFLVCGDTLVINPYAAFHQFEHMSETISQSMAKTSHEVHASVRRLDSSRLSSCCIVLTVISPFRLCCILTVCFLTESFELSLVPPSSWELSERMVCCCVGSSLSFPWPDFRNVTVILIDQSATVFLFVFVVVVVHHPQRLQ